MTKHDRLMNALTEIKEVCIKATADDGGCAKRCPFLMKPDGDFCDCEIMKYLRYGVATPNEWGTDGEDDD